MPDDKTIQESLSPTPVAGEYDVVVCGGGPAGCAAALAAAEGGAKTLLLETHGCLGGVWTAGNLAWIIDGDKPGIMKQIKSRLDQVDARRPRDPAVAEKRFAYNPELMKLILEEMMDTAGVDIQLHSRVVAAVLDGNRQLQVVVTESKSGRQAWRGKVFIDATGDGDAAALAGCEYAMGNPENGQVQPMTMTALVTGIHFHEVEPFVGGGRKEPKEKLAAELRRAGVTPSYALPVLFCIDEDFFALAADHQYGIYCNDAAAVTRATIRGRSECHQVIEGLRSLGGIWRSLKLVATPAQIGVREGRRIRGIYEITVDDLLAGARHEDAVCRVDFGIDVHSTTHRQGEAFDSKNKLRTQPYDIPYRALVARDVKGLLMAGRCVSGDFLAHSSYRVTGNAVAMGEAAGKGAAACVDKGIRPDEYKFSGGGY